MLAIYLWISLIHITKCLFIKGRNYTVYEITTFNSHERAELYNLHVKENHVYFLTGVSNEAALPMEVVLDSTEAEIFEKELLYNDIQYTSILYKAFPKSDQQDFQDDIPDIVNTFLTYDNIVNWVDKKSKLSHILNKREIAKTSENRGMLMLKVASGRKKPAVFVMGGEEGRDWISPAIIINFINNLLENENSQKLTDYYDLYFMPVFNPDGYVYSMNEDRFWAKNRKAFFPRKHCPDNQIAIGVNVDRNWHTPHDILLTSECNAVYIGHEAFSEEESKTTQAVLNSIAARLIAFINVRGSEKMITIPYADNSTLCNNHDILMEILSSVVNKLRSNHNVSYFYGTSAKLLYNFIGNCADWVKKMLNVPIVYTVYMEYEDSLLPETHHISRLTEQFTTIMNEILFIAKDIYGPLFNHEISHLIHGPIMILIFLVVTVLIFI